MRGLFQNKPFVIMLIAIVLLGILAFATSGERSVTWLESTVGTVVQPVQTFASKASNEIIGFVQRIFKTTDADKALEQLSVRLAQLETVEEENERLRAENERLKALLNYSEISSDYTLVTASVIGNSQGIWFDVFTINAGRNKGIETDMPVVNADGLIGRVTEVGATWSKVTAIIDSGTEVSVMVERTRDIGLSRGTLDTGEVHMLELYFLASGYDLVPGDVITTNGMGSVYPRGITVGTVTEVSRSSDASTSRNAVIQPSVDFSHLEEVMVITGTEAEEGEE
ncbi:MAG: rod shape-determining protein MreC [Clostridiales bacterium]|nr:rod shape-determining protein MreC [Clostridiales bacterium]